MPEPEEVLLAEVVVQGVHERTIRSPVELHAATGQGDETALSRPLAQFAEQPCLSDTRFPDHLDHPWRTGQGVLDRAVEDRQLGCPAHQAAPARGRRGVGGPVRTAPTRGVGTGGDTGNGRGTRRVRSPERARRAGRSGRGRW